MRHMSIAILMVCIPKLALADGLAYIPKWHMNGDEACYSFDQAKTLVQLDSKLSLCVKEEAEQPALIADLKLTVGDLQAAVTAAQQDRDLWKTNATQLSTDLKQCNVDKAKAEDHSASSFGWVVAGALALVGGGIYLGSRLSHK